MSGSTASAYRLRRPERERTDVLFSSICGWFSSSHDCRVRSWERSLKISIIHPTARVPNGWLPAAEQAVRNAVSPGDIEYIVVVDTVDKAAFMGFSPDSPLAKVGRFRLIVNPGRRTSAEAYNLGAKAATGDLLFCMQDDIWCPQAWDAALLGALVTWKTGNPLVDASIVRVSSVKERDDQLYNPQILSRKRYEDCGYVFWPEYLSMYADNEFTEAAKQDGVVIDARHLHFEERHPAFGTAPDDAVYRHENREVSYVVGKAIFERRQVKGFPKREPFLVRDEATVQAELDRRKRVPTMTVCLPGEDFPQAYLHNWTNLLMYLVQRFNLRCQFGYSTDVFACRNWFVDKVLEHETPDWVLWIDDDNILEPEAFQALFDAAQQPGAPDILAAWCWIYNQAKQEYSVSCGRIETSADGLMATIPANPLVFSGQVELKDYTGFPAVLHRGSILEKGCFDHYPGLPGEDVAFCKRIVDNGGTVGVHTGIQIPHLKRVNLAPDMTKLKLKEDEETTK